MTEQKQGWFSRLTTGLKKSTNKITDTISSVITKKKLDQDMLDEIEESLILSDMGVATASKIIQRLKKKRFEQNISIEEVKQFLADEIFEIIKAVEGNLELDTSLSPHVIMMVGVNGSGKTTTMGKWAFQYKNAGQKVAMAACDTFRAAAVDQLRVWAERADVALIEDKAGSDPAGVAYKAVELTKNDCAQVLLIDTAGRLHNKQTLMEELQKMIRVIQKIDETAPHHVVLVIDAHIGQNAIQQVKAFQEAVDISGLVITKLDGTAKAGIVINLAKTFNLPIYGIGVGESIDDLIPFNAKDFAYNLMGIESIRKK